MALDSRYVIAPSMEQYFVDKDTGLPLANGKVTFYKDQARTELKPIYTISGTPPNYVYVQLPNPIELSAVGTIQDANGNNVIPYYFPYNKNGDIELYYITVYSEGGVLHFTREGWPNYMAPTSGEASNSLVNYVPNGQFLLHNNISATSTTVAGQITQPVTIVAQGGWSFNRPETSSATDFVLFPRYNSPITNPTSSPRYAVRISTTVTGAGDLYKDLRLTFKDVNKFADTTQTLSFTAQTNTSTDLSLTLLLIKNFGEGGSPEESEVISTIEIKNTPSIINQPIEFSNNIDRSIGPNNDDYIQIAIRLPLSFIFDATFTDFVLTPGDVDITEFPQTTTAQFIYRTSGYMPPPNTDGFDLFLPRIKTLEGEQYDDSQIGQCVLQVRNNPLPGELTCDGANYLYSGYSKEGIPYKRLGDVLLENGYPKFGTGINFVSAKVNNLFLTITTNTTGAATNSSAGTSGFTVTTAFVGNNYDVTSYYLGADTSYVRQNNKNSVTGPLAQTASPYLTIANIRNVANTFALFSIKVTSANNAIAGKWFQFSSTKKTYYVWFTVDGKGTDPKPTNLTPIKIDLPGTLDINSRANFISEALAGHQLTAITVKTAETITAGSYFTFSVNSTLINQNYYVWYRKDGMGIDPAPGGIGIVVDVVTGDNQTNILNKTIAALNKFYVTVPDTRGTFIRIWNKGASNDPDIALRAFPYGQGQITGDMIGSMQLDEIISHIHPPLAGTNYAYKKPRGGYAGGEYGIDSTVTTGSAGGSESRPRNQYLNMFIKY